VKTALTAPKSRETPGWEMVIGRLDLVKAENPLEEIKWKKLSSYTQAVWILPFFFIIFDLKDSMW
jgi:hypothetical protein